MGYSCIKFFYLFITLVDSWDPLVSTFYICSSSEYYPSLLSNCWTNIFHFQMPVGIFVTGYIMYVFIITSQVIQWCTQHKDDDPTQPEEDAICLWDVEFLKVDQGTLFELILVSC